MFYLLKIKRILERRLQSYRFLGLIFFAGVISNSGAESVGWAAFDMEQEDSTEDELSSRHTTSVEEKSSSEEDEDEPEEEMGQEMLPDLGQVLPEEEKGADITVEEFVARKIDEEIPQTMGWGLSLLTQNANHRVDCQAVCQGPCQSFHRRACQITYDTASQVFARSVLQPELLEDRAIALALGEADFILSVLELLCKGLAQLLDFGSAGVAIDYNLQIEIADLLKMTSEFDGLDVIHALPQPFLATHLLKRRIRTDADRTVLITHYQTALEAFKSYGRSLIPTVPVEERR